MLSKIVVSRDSPDEAEQIEAADKVQGTLVKRRGRQHQSILLACVSLIVRIARVAEGRRCRVSLCHVGSREEHVVDDALVQLDPSRGRVVLTRAAAAAGPADAAGVRSPHDLRHVVLGAPARGEVGVVHGGYQGHGAGAAAVQVAQREGEVLDGVRGEAVLVLEHVVVDRAGGALDPGVGLEVEVELLRVADVGE